MADFRKLTKTDVLPLIHIEMAQGDDHFVAPNAVTMAQCLFQPSATIYGIWEEETPVGMITICDLAHPQANRDETDDTTGYYIWRLMIGAPYKRRGLGTAALNFAQTTARSLGRTYIVLTAEPDEGTPIPFYEKNGFSKTGRVIDGEVELIKRL